MYTKRIGIDRQYLIYLGVAISFLIISNTLANVLNTTFPAIFFLLIVSMLSVFFHDKNTIIIFLMLNIFQNLFLTVCSNGLDSVTTLLVIIIKESIIYISILPLFLNGRRISTDRIDLMFVIFVIISVVNLLSQTNSLRAGISSLRQMLLVFICYYFGNSIEMKSYELRLIVAIIINLAFFLSVLGLIMVFFDDQVWISMGYQRYWINKTGSSPTFSNFYTFDFGLKLKRVVSIITDPLALAHILGMALVCILSKCVKCSKVITATIAIAFIFTLSKSSYLLLILTFVFELYTKFKSRNDRLFFMYAILTVGLCLLIYMKDYISKASSAGIHLMSFLYGIKNMSLVGLGIGNIGYTASMSGLLDYDILYNESFFSTCMGQIGIIGTSVIYFFMIAIFYNNYKLYWRTKENIVKAIVILQLAILIETLVSASSISMVGTGMYFVLAGCVNRVYGINRQRRMIIT